MDEKKLNIITVTVNAYGKEESFSVRDFDERLLEDVIVTKGFCDAFDAASTTVGDLERQFRKIAENVVFGRLNIAEANVRVKKEQENV